MLRKITLFLFFIPAFASAQWPAKPDTIYVADSTQPGLEHVTIYGYKGAVKVEGALLNKKRLGVWREYNEGSGVLMRSEEFRNGIRHGACLQMGPNGTVTVNETYVDGVLQGYRMTYSNSGRIKSQEYYKNGKLQGRSKTFYENARLQEEGNWKNGERDSITTWYSQTGQLSLMYTYKAGQLEGHSISYDEKGAKKQEGDFKNNLEEGEWLVYADSVIQKKVIYKAGQVIREIPVKK